MRTRLGIRGSDVVLAVVVLAIVLLGTAHIEASGSERPVDTLAVACGVVAASALVLWRRFPLPMVGVVAAAMFVYLARDYPGGPALLPGPVALALVGFRTHRAVGFGAAAFVAVAVFVGRWIGEGHLDVMAIVGTGWSFAAVFAGQLVATRNERIAADRERADLHERQVIADERLRIARDLHDTVAHAMATINVQSGVAAHLLDRRPEQAREALEAIRSASSDALDELGAILGVLRQGGDLDSAAPRAPVPGLDQLDELVARARVDGLAVECAVKGEVAVVGPTLSTTAYRVVQEALSNSRRHAGEGAAAAVTVTVDGAHRLGVEVVDDGGRRPRTAATPPASTIGLGLVGMRERVESTGGVLSVGPRRGPGFRVSASWDREDP